MTDLSAPRKKGEAGNAYREPAPEARPRVKVAKQTSFAMRALGVFFTFHYVCLAWIFFRATSFQKAVQVLKQIAQGTTFHPNLPPIVLAVLALGFVAHFWPDEAFEKMKRGFTALPAVGQGAALFLVAVILHEAASTQAIPFIYFQF
ncbi:MAG: hypothetical protein R3F14_31700 [Polyangiaceae bacterium]